MKKILILPFIIITIYCSAQSSIIGNPIKFSNWEISQYTFPNSMNWREALNACKELGDGWQLPSKEQLNILYKNKNEIGGFVNDAYWSATNSGDYEAWRQYFSDGDQVLTPNYSVGYVRAIRELAMDSSEVVNLQQNKLLNTPEDFAKTVLLSLKTKNQDLYETTAPTFPELKFFLESINESPEFNEELNSAKKENRLKWFSDIVSDAVTRKLNLNESIYCGFQGDISSFKNTPYIRKGFICFEIDSKKYQIEVEKVFKINNEWKAVENLLGIKSIENENQANELEEPTINVSVSDDEFREIKWSKGKPFKTTINTASDKRKYSAAKLAQLNNPKSIIGTPGKIGKLLISQNEFPLKMSWSQAKLACQKLGPGWRLPTKDELYILYQNKNKLGNFSKYGYWSLTQDSVDGVAWWQDFYLGSTKPTLQNKLSTWGVRAVKTL